MLISVDPRAIVKQDAHPITSDFNDTISHLPIRHKSQKSHVLPSTIAVAGHGTIVVVAISVTIVAANIAIVAIHVAIVGTTLGLSVCQIRVLIVLLVSFLLLSVFAVMLSSVMEDNR